MGFPKETRRSPLESVTPVKLSWRPSMRRKRVVLCPTSWRAREILRELFVARGWDVVEETEALDDEAAEIDLVWCAGRDVPWMKVLEGATGARGRDKRSRVARSPVRCRRREDGQHPEAEGEAPVPENGGSERPAACCGCSGNPR